MLDIELVDKDMPTPEITCFMQTLSGDKQIYKIVGDSIFYFNQKVKLDGKIITLLKSIPQTVLEGNKQIGCGVCLDGVDYKFVFKTSEGETTWTIQPNQKIKPKEIDDYFRVLISLYSEIVTN